MIAYKSDNSRLAEQYKAGDSTKVVVADWLSSMKHLIVDCLSSAKRVIVDLLSDTE